MKKLLVVVELLFQFDKGNYMTIHGIYLKTRPQGKWHLVSVVVSPEVANLDSDEVLKNALSQGNDKAEVAIQSYDSTFHIPELLSKVKEQKLLFN